MNQPTDGPGRRSGPDGLRAVDRTIRILLALAASPTGTSLTDLARGTDISAPTAHRLLGALRRHRLTRETVDGRHALGPATLVLARGFLGGLDFRVEALPVLSELRDATGEACHLGTLAAPHIVYVDKLGSTHPVQVMTRIGGTAPALTTALGRALLANSPAEVVRQVVTASEAQLGPLPAWDPEELDRTRERGYSIDDGESAPGIVALGAPIFDSEGAAIAAIDVAVPAVRFDRERREELGGLVRASADRVSSALGHPANGPDLPTDDRSDG
ncbi:IclR family transcriptional regulator [Salana multivorans]|uniref:IclR family transcriptional regulator n=1 Tax=Salana multivorans TaxID=120377 RepID=A0A3N2D8N9_9MICO|nr:IclR family transcriptional regulator [Salana multivorans]MBN8882468.1 IclR family transcriptional regulator [Salana multivorans]OJX97479.1 MAG: hypothetical protein BGO96_06150 [Micrococcales bacterium 73-15]ROR96139.1 IclR family transcriptional regulator [Salana multivorans]